MEDAELEGWESSFLRGRALERWLRVETPDCCEMERSRGAEYEALVTSMASCQLWHVAVTSIASSTSIGPSFHATSFAPRFAPFFLPRRCER